MVPGSGPSDRDNDVYFPAIRAGLLDRGIAAASFDKRGVGESTGDWRDTGPAEQAADVAAQLACLRETRRCRSGTARPVRAQPGRLGGARGRRGRPVRRVRDHELGPGRHDGAPGTLRDGSPHDRSRRSRRGGGRRARDAGRSHGAGAGRSRLRDRPGSRRRGRSRAERCRGARPRPPLARPRSPPRPRTAHVPAPRDLRRRGSRHARRREHRRLPCRARRASGRAGDRRRFPAATTGCRAASRRRSTPPTTRRLETGSSAVTRDENETLTPMQATGIPAAELAARRETLLQHVRSHGLTGYVLFDESYIQYFTSFGFLATERPVAFVCKRLGGDGGFRPRVRGRARARRDRVRAGRVLPGVPGHRAPDADPGARAAGHGDHRRRRRRPERLSGHPRLPGPGAERGDRAACRAARAVHREPDGAQERGRGRADPRERPLVRARAPAPAGVLAPGSDRSRGQPPRRPRSNARDARGARHVVRRAAGILRRRVGGIPRPDRAAGARGRTRSRTTSSSRRATSSSPRRAPRSGATTPSSSAR